MKSIRTLGIAAAMALALMAFAGATSASANFFKAGVEPEAWSGSLTGKSHVMQLGSETFTCEKSTFAGETSKKSLSEATVAPELKSCVHLGLTATWTMNGCKFRFHPGAGPSLAGSVDIVGCEAPMSTTSEGCVTEIGNQNGLGSVVYKNVLVGGIPTITATASLSSLTYTRSGAGYCYGGKGTFSNGTYAGEWSVKGTTKPGGLPAALEVESTPAAALTKFALEEAPATIAGADSGVKKRIVGGQNGLNCGSYGLSGTSASLAPEAVTLTPIYKECTVGGEAVPDSFVSSGGCSYLFQANGGFAIAGATCASNPITVTRPGCVLAIGPQSGLSGIVYANAGSGKLRTVSVSGSTAKVTYTVAGASCMEPGTFSNGIINTSSKLTATNSSGALQGLSVE